MSSSNDKKEGQPKISYDEDDREMVTLSGNRTIYGICFRDNQDGTTTYYPETTVSFFGSNDYKMLQQEIPSEELALLQKMLSKASPTTSSASATKTQRQLTQSGRKHATSSIPSRRPQTRNTCWSLSDNLRNPKALG